METNRASGRLASIDVLRGLAALAVVLYHAFHKGVFDPEPYRGWATWADWLLLGPVSFGYVGVYLFFVISGFCIHLKVAKSLAAGREAEIDFRAFWKRRLRRLYPAYLAALALYFLVAWLWIGDFNFKTAPAWDIISHLLLIHNFDPLTVFSLNGVFWTLALEEQLYLAYFGLLWLRRRYGWTRTLIICVMARVVWLVGALGLGYAFGWNVVTLESAAANWCIWALGALAVECYFGYVKLPEWCYNWQLAAALSALAGALAYVFYITYETGVAAWWAKLLMQPLWGAAFFIIVNLAVRYEARKTWRISAFWVKGLMWLGLISYSLYLTHELVFHLESQRPWLAVPLTIVVAWIFFQLFEKPFLAPPKPRPAQADTDERGFFGLEQPLRKRAHIATAQGTDY